MLALIAAAALVPAAGVLPDVTLTNMDGKAVRLREYAGRKVILFNWASW